MNNSNFNRVALCKTFVQVELIQRLLVAGLATQNLDRQLAVPTGVAVGCNLVPLKGVLANNCM